MRQLQILLAIFAVLAVLPLLLTSDFWLNAVMMALFAALIGQAWNIAAGYAGQFSFGHALFFGIGGYAVAVLQVRLGVNPWLGMIAGGALGAAAGAGLGWLTFRYNIRGSYFALVTLAFAEVFRILANSVPFTGAGEGILIALHPSPAMMQFKGLAGYYWLLLALTLASFLTVWRLGRTRLGAQMLAVRDNEDAAAAIGVDAFAVKVKALALSGLFMGLAGVFYTQRYLYLDPGLAFGPTQSVEALLVAIVGGIGSLFGPLLGAFALHALGEVAQSALGNIPGANMVIYGTVLVGMVLFLPRGLTSLGRPRARKRRRAKDA